MNNSNEADIYDLLLRDRHDPANHTLPCEVVRTLPKTPLLVLPYAFQASFGIMSYSILYDCMDQILEVWYQFSIA